MKKGDIGVLVKLLERTAMLDKTSPDQDNLLFGWDTDKQLRFIENFVLVGENNPEAYADICRITRALVGDSDEMAEIAALLELEIFNGERRLPISSKREKMLEQMVKDLQKVISALPEVTRKLRCESLFEYHAGEFYNVYSRFNIAAEAKKRSAVVSEQSGDKAGAAIGWFQSKLFDLKHTLCSKQPGDELKNHFARLEVKFTELTEALRGTTLEVQWAESNAPAHMVQACVLLNLRHPEWDKWVATTLEAAIKRGIENSASTEFIRAADLAYHDDSQANAALKVVAESNDANEIRATALLILARRAMAIGDRQKAKEFVGSMPIDGAQHVRAAAERLFI